MYKRYQLETSMVDMSYYHTRLPYVLHRPAKPAQSSLLAKIVGRLRLRVNNAPVVPLDEHEMCYLYRYLNTNK